MSFAIKKLMKKMMLLLGAVLGVASASCERLDDGIDGKRDVFIESVAEILASVDLEKEQMDEVHTAVTSSAGNGYDEEYMMRDLFACPGAGVGEEKTKAGEEYRSRPLRDLISETVMALTKAESAAVLPKGMSAEEFLEELETSDIQIYWPYSELWDGKSMPVLTYEPEDGGDTNTGYEMVVDERGGKRLREVEVDEKMAMERPVWVVNRNSDSAYRTIELLRKMDPAWSEGGNVIVHPQDSCRALMSKAGDDGGDRVRTLVLKDFTMLRNYDCWFAGASEFFVKIGSVENFTASTEAEMRLYSPTVTDFMIVVKRKEMGVKKEMNAVLVSKWTDQLESCAFLITEDDGGTKTSWKCEATVKYNSKSFGFNLELPFSSRDDIVWRGELAVQYLERTSGKAGRFGDTSITFEIQEY